MKKFVLFASCCFCLRQNMSVGMNSSFHYGVVDP